MTTSRSAHTMRTRRRPTTALRRLAAGAAALLTVAACGGSADSAESSGPTLPPDATTIVAASATAMGEVTSVSFLVAPSGAPIFIDQFDSIAITKIVGEFELTDTTTDTDTTPDTTTDPDVTAEPLGGAQAVLDVVVNGSLNTQLAAVALGEEVWLSNPVTGGFETLPAGFDLDPSRFFDPQNGWQPLLENLSDVEFVGRVDRDGDRYHLRGVAPAEQVRVITAGLVRNQDVAVDIWVDPVTGLVYAIEFTTEIDGGITDWVVELDGYGDDYDITPPPEAA